MMYLKDLGFEEDVINSLLEELEFAKYCSRFDDNGIIPVINED